MYPRLFVVILTWNNYLDTKTCVESVQLSEGIDATDLQLVVVDNHSTDGSLEQLRGHFSHHDALHFLVNEANLGFAKGMNAGIRWALGQGADYVLLLNNDTVVAKDFVHAMLSAACQDESVGIIGPRVLYYEDPQRIWQGGGRFSPILGRVVMQDRNKSEEMAGRCKLYVGFLNGSALLVKREVFETVGLLDGDFFFYAEDLDFCLRARKAGIRLLYVPEARVWHKVAGTSKGWCSPFSMYHQSKNRLLLFRKNFCLPYFIYGFFNHLLIYTPLKTLQAAYGSSSSMVSIWAWLMGIYDFCRGRGSPRFLP